MNGKDDDLRMEGIIAWRECTNKTLKIINFEGNHFFIFNNFDRIGSIINKNLV